MIGARHLHRVRDLVQVDYLVMNCTQPISQGRWSLIQQIGEFQTLVTVLRFFWSMTKLLTGYDPA